jgi:hypothetical protein
MLIYNIPNIDANMNGFNWESDQNQNNEYQYNQTFFDFSMGCAYGYLTSAKAYAATIKEFGDAERLRADIKNFAATHHVFEEACVGGHLEVVEWLVDFSGMTTDDVVNTEFVDMFINTCFRKKTKVAHWLCDNLIPIWDINAINSDAVSIYDSAFKPLQIQY